MTDLQPTHQSLREATADALLARAARAQAEGRAPSYAVGIVRDGGLAWAAGRGTLAGATVAESVEPVAPTTDTQYRIGSITKGFAAVGVMRLRDEGLLSLDDPIEQHLTDTALTGTTIRDLLSHSAGLAAEPAGPWWERSPGQSWDALADTFGPELTLRAHGQFHYSNPGYALLGRLVEVHRGVSWYDALRREVLDPLGMTRTTYDPVAPAAPGLAVHPYADVVMPEVVQDLGAMAPAGQLWSSIGDLARWIGFICGDGGEVLAADTIAEMRETNVIANDPKWTSGYGLGFQVFRPAEREYVGHGGSVPGFVAFIAADVERRTGTIELANTTGSGMQFCGFELLELLQQHEPFVADVWRPAPDTPADLLDVAGAWHWGPNAMVLHLRGADLLELLPPGGARGRAGRFRKDAAGRWVGLDGYWRDEILTVVRRADGTVSHLDLGTFVWTRLPYDADAPIPGGVQPDGWTSGASPA